MRGRGFLFGPVAICAGGLGATLATPAWTGAVQAQDLPPPEAPGALAAPPADEGGLFSSGVLLTLGFSFVVGLAVGFALKIAFKIAIVTGGLFLVGLFALQYAGIVDVNWTGMEARYDGFADWLGAYARGLKDFMADNLASATSFTAGLITGLKL